MSKPSEMTPRRGRLGAVTGVTGVTLVALAGTLLHLPMGATAGIAPGAVETPAPPSAAPTAARTLGNYQLRCWQYGRLLFEETSVSLPADARIGARLVAIDRHGLPLIVTDAGGATCQARAAGPARGAR